MKRKTLNEHKAWQKYKKWQKEHSSQIREGQEIRSLGEFKEIYNSAGRKLDIIKHEVRFQMKQRTFNALNRAYKEQTGSKTGLPKELRSKSTSDVAKYLMNNQEKNILREFIKIREREKLNEIQGWGSMSKEEQIKLKKRINNEVWDEYEEYFLGS